MTVTWTAPTITGGQAPVPTMNGKIATLATVSGVTLVDLYKDFTATSFYNAISAKLETKKVTVQPLR